MARGRVDVRRPKGRGSRYYREHVIANDLCVFCGEPSQSTDHIFPTSLGGWNHWTNFAPTCIKCNNAKGSMSLLEFLMRPNRMKFGGRNIKLTRRQYERMDDDFYETDVMWHDPLGLQQRKNSEYSGIRI